MNNRTSIMVDNRNKLKLKALKKSGESYNDVISRLIGDLAKTGEYHYIIYNGLFRISFILDYKNKKGVFLDEEGNKTEKLEKRNYYDEKEVQKSYEYFIQSINDAMNSKYSLIKHAFNTDVGEIKNFDGFILERVY